MVNLNPEEFENVVNPYTLAKQEQEEIVAEINDVRLTNPPGDYFRLKLVDESIDIPKLKYISIKTKDGKISRLSVVDYIVLKLSS